MLLVFLAYCIATSGPNRTTTQNNNPIKFPSSLGDILSPLFMVLFMAFPNKKYIPYNSKAAANEATQEAGAVAPFILGRDLAAMKCHEAAILLGNYKAQAATGTVDLELLYSLQGAFNELQTILKPYAIDRLTKTQMEESLCFKPDVSFIALLSNGQPIATQKIVAYYEELDKIARMAGFNKYDNIETRKPKTVEGFLREVFQRKWPEQFKGFFGINEENKENKEKIS